MRSKEIIEKRTLTSKTYQIGKNRFRGEFHVGHIHYRPGYSSGFEDIDVTFVPTKNGWEIKKANYEFFAPRYSTDKFIFVNKYNFDCFNHHETDFSSPDTIAFKCENVRKVEGKLVDNSVVYENAYGDGIDLVIHPTKARVEKLVKIKTPKAFKSLPSLDYIFYFPPITRFFTFPKDVKIDSKQMEEERLRLEKEKKDFALARQKLEEMLKEEKKQKLNYLSPLSITTFSVVSDHLVFKKNKFTWLRPPTLRDAEGEIFECSFKLSPISPQEIKLTKLFPKVDLAKLKFPVMIDVVESYYVGVGDGKVSRSDSDWDTARNTLDGETVNYTDTVTYATVNYFWETYNCHRSFFPIDTSALPDNASISAASLFLYTASYNADEDGQNFCLVQATQASVTQLTTDDYDECGALNNPTEGAARIPTPATTEVWNEFVLNTNGIEWISLTGYTKFGVRSSLDVDNIAPTGYNSTDFQTSESDYDPYLEVTYETAAAAVINFLTPRSKYWGG